ncbi:MAG: methyltransferase domain-containing protein [Nanoarchaeota archaeon]
MTDKFYLDRMDITMSLISKDKKEILILGDSNKEYVPTKLRERDEGFLVKTLNLAGDADIISDLNKKIPLKNDSVDCVVAGEVLEHLYGTNFFLEEVHRVLKKDGEFILSIPNVVCFKNRIKVLFGKLPTYCADTDEWIKLADYSGHVKDFNLELIKRLLISKGFKIKVTTTNGIYVRFKKVFPRSLTPTTFGDGLIIKSVK